MGVEGEKASAKGRQVRTARESFESILALTFDPGSYGNAFLFQQDALVRALLQWGVFF